GGLRVGGEALRVLVGVARVLRAFAAVDVALAHRGRIAGEVVGGRRGARTPLRRLRRRLDFLRRRSRRNRGASGGEEKDQDRGMSSHRILRALPFDTMRPRQLLAAIAALVLAFAAYAAVRIG